MAKGNLFLGMARGSVGDVTMYRANGEQISRARNRHPSNPRTDRQLVTRAITASVSRLYSVGQELFNHSIAGFSPGALTQQEWLKRNNRILRSLYLNAREAQSSNDGRYGAPGVAVAVPFVGMMVSDGNYEQTAFSFNDTYGFELPTIPDQSTVKSYAELCGLFPGDIYTFGGISVGTRRTPVFDGNNGNDSSVFPCKFGYIQLKVKDNVTSSTTSITPASLYSVLFDLYYQAGASSILSLPLNEDIQLGDLIGWGDNGIVFCIRSKYGDVSKRSASFALPATADQGYGLTYDNVLPAWGDPSSYQDPTLILNGSEFTG